MQGHPHQVDASRKYVGDKVLYPTGYNTYCISAATSSGCSPAVACLLHHVRHPDQTVLRMHSVSHGISSNLQRASYHR